MTHLPEIIHRLVRDSAFRTQFHENPYSALEAAHLSLDPATLEILCGCEHLFQIAPDQLWARLASEEPTEWAHSSGRVSEAYSHAD
jgi:hypothetical protein